ncbi:MAG: hypothetical protein J6Q89_08435 [Clostridia bacterium]|nr:hypothetical protein [Clostridia bacterium]
MKKTTTIICLCLIVFVFAFMFIFSVCLPRTTVSDYSILKEWPEFSFKTLFSGEYISDVIYCFTDTIHGRDRFIDYEAKISDLYGLKEDQEVIDIYTEESDEFSESSESSDEVVSSDNSLGSVDISDETSEDVSPEQSEGSNESSTETSTESSENSTDQPVDKLPPEISGSVLIVGTRALELYGGNEANAALYAQVLNEFAENLDKSVNVYSMVIPKASAYYVEQAKGYEGYVFLNKRDIDKITNTLSDRVIDVNIYNILGQHANEDIYFRTDHHWTALGAYYASSVFAEKAGVSFDVLSAFREERREGYLGTMYKYSNHSTTLLNNPEDFVAYYPDSSYKTTYYSATDLKSSAFDHDDGFFWQIGDKQKSSWYSTFILGDSYSVKAVSNDCKNGRKLLIVKDSYGNALAPFMIEGFEEIYIVDARKYELSLIETVEEFGITDVLFAECTFSAVGTSYIDDLKEICK